jgi:hypothetical protein
MRTIAIAVFLFAFTSIAVAADAAKAASAQKAPKVPLLEKFSCRTGPNDHQARLIAEVVKGRPMEFAFYSRLGTRVCSVHGRRGDAYSNWEDAEEGKTAVKLYSGNAGLEYRPGYLKLTFADVGRMHYCGMHGDLNGMVEVIAKKAECGLEGVFESGVE